MTSQKIFNLHFSFTFIYLLGRSLEQVFNVLYTYSLIHYYSNLSKCFFLSFRPEHIIPDDGEECSLVEIDPQQRKRYHTNSIYDEDDDGGHPGRSQVQCQTS